jgi:hypothetical protein
MARPPAEVNVTGAVQVVQLIVAEKVAVKRDVGVDETRSGPGTTNPGSPVASGAGADVKLTSGAGAVVLTLTSG